VRKKSNKRRAMKTLCVIILIVHSLFAGKVTLLEVEGSSTEEVKPNIMLFSAYVETKDSVGNMASFSAKKIADRVIDTIRKLDPDAIFSSNGLNTSKEYQQSNSPVQFSSSCYITIKSKYVNRASEFYDAIIASGSTRTGSPQFFIANYDSVKNLVRKKAYENGKKRAEQIAVSYQTTISRQVGIKDYENAHITDHARNYYNLFNESVGMSYQLMSASMRAEPTSGSFSDALMNSQTIKISHSVKLIYELNR